MELEIITIYCRCDDFLISSGYQDDPQTKMSTAEIMTTALTAAAFFAGDHEKSRCFLKEHDYIPDMLSKSQFSRRLHRIPESLWRAFMELNAQAAHAFNPLKTYLIDSFPVPVCHNIRIKNSRIYQEEEFRGYNASKKVYFYGLKVHLLISESGIPVELFFSPGAYSDISSLYDFTFPLPEGSYVHGDKAYNIHDIEDDLKNGGIHLMPVRKKNSKRKYDFFTERGIGYIRKRIESVFSVITQRFPRHIHAVTHRGFELKILMFILVYGIQASIL
ncbi:MAG: IS982 family transposase [Gammaproteobacteria bacterium]|nr:IS982 family transposase [Gammaproteobacteria bacterium]